MTISKRPWCRNIALFPHTEVEHEVPCSEMGAFSPAYERAMARQEATKVWPPNDTACGCFLRLVDMRFAHLATLFRYTSQFRDAREDDSSGFRGTPFGNPFAFTGADDKAIPASRSPKSTSSQPPETKRPRIGIVMHHERVALLIHFTSFKLTFQYVDTL